MDMHSTEYAHSMARGLGWFSIGLGLAEVLAPRALTRGLGMEGNEQLVQAYGLREIATGIGILSSDQPAPWIWGRVGGDALDMATLAGGLQPDNRRKRTWRWLLPPLPASRRWMSSAGPRLRVMPARSHASS